MTAHADILDEREKPLGRWVVASLLLHVTVMGAAAGYGWWANRGRASFGDPHAMGGSVGITPVNSIPLPRRSRVENPVANDTESTVPSPPKEAKKKPPAVREDPDAVPMKTRNRPDREPQVAQNQQYRAQPDRPNQVYSPSGAAASTPMFGGQQGMGGVGGSGNQVFGVRLGWYAQMLIQTMAQKWGVESARISPGAQNSRRATLAFEILRDGTVRNVRVLESSGNYEVDTAAQRAVMSASPVRRLPEEFERNTASVEFWFQLQR